MLSCCRRGVRAGKVVWIAGWMYVSEQTSARDSYLDKAHSGLPAWVHFPASDSGEECLMPFSDPSY